MTSYDQYCPIARGLDVIGDRWTLLVLRELSLGPRRFTDLRALLDGIPPNVLSQRLKRLAADGLIQQEYWEPPAARSVYALTPRGREVLPVLRAVARFGLPELEAATEEHVMEPLRVLGSIFVPWFDAGASSRLDVDEEYHLTFTDEPTPRHPTVHLSSRPPGFSRESGVTPAVTVSGPSWAFIRLRQGGTLEDLPLEVTGSKAAVRRFETLFDLGTEAATPSRPGGRGGRA